MRLCTGPGASVLLQVTLLEGTLELYERDPGGADQFEKVAAVAAHPRCPVARAEVEDLATSGKISKILGLNF